MSTLERAVEIARLAHQGQTDKRGGPYLDHVLPACRFVSGHEVATNSATHGADLR